MTRVELFLDELKVGLAKLAGTPQQAVDWYAGIAENENAQAMIANRSDSPPSTAVKEYLGYLEGGPKPFWLQ